MRCWLVRPAWTSRSPQLAAARQKLGRDCQDQDEQNERERRRPRSRRTELRGQPSLVVDVDCQRLLVAVERARAAFANPSIWKKLQLAGMRQDFSWDRSAGEYVKLYERALSKGD